MSDITVQEFYDALDPDLKKGATGIIEFIIKDKNGEIVDHHIEKNVIKIFAKEMLAHRLPSSEVWDPEANGGAGDWVASGIDPTEEFAARYILFGASFDENGAPLGVNDPRYYTQDPVTGSFVPVRLTPAADFNGGLINAIPIEEPDRPLKRVENINFSPTYQPSSSPLVDSSVRAMNNIVQLETVLRIDEYNGFGVTDNDIFTITEVALAGGYRFDAVGSCDLVPSDLFLIGVPSGDEQISVAAVANGTNVVTISDSEPTSSLAAFKQGGQIKLANRDGTQSDHETLNQVNPYYLVTEYSGGRDLVLDRVPVDDQNSPLTGDVGVFDASLRIFSHRILSFPVQKSENFEITVRWNIIFN